MPVRVHKVQYGETLTDIAVEYGFQRNIDPIWKYNTVVRKNLNSANPNKIPAGVSILIPRTVAEYDEAIRSLKSLLQEVDKDTAKSLQELEGYKAEADRVGAYVDIAADVALAAKGAVRASIKLGPRYAKYIMRKEAMKAALDVTYKLTGIADANEDLVVKNAGKAVVDQGVMLQARRAFDAQKANKSFREGVVKSMGKKAVVTSAKAIAPVEMANGTSEVVDVLCDVALALGKGAVNAVEAIAPSKVAKAFVWFRSGEHPDDTNKRMKDYVASSGRRSAERLRETIQKLQQEKTRVHGVQ